MFIYNFTKFSMIMTTCWWVLDLETWLFGYLVRHLFCYGLLVTI